MGLVGNARYMEMADFLLGFAGIDIAGDDGRKLGQSPQELDTPFAWARGEPEPIYTHCERCGGRLYAPGVARGPGGWSPVRSVRSIFVRREPANVCHCPASQPRTVARRPRRRIGLPLPSLPRTPPVPTDKLAVSQLPEDCPVRQALEGKSRGATVLEGGQAVARGAATAVKIGWQVARFTVRALVGATRFVSSLVPDRREPQRPQPRAASAREQPARP